MMVGSSIIYADAGDHPVMATCGQGEGRRSSAVVGEFLTGVHASIEP
jgi:hypothetical protein